MVRKVATRSKILLVLAFAITARVAFARPAQTSVLPATGQRSADHHASAQPELMPAEQQAFQEGFSKFIRTLELALRASKSPRDRAFSTLLPQFDTSRPISVQDNLASGNLLRAAAKAAPQDVLVQWIWANAQDQASGCTHADPCPGRARALAVLEPDNGAAWIPAIAQAYWVHDMSAYDEALERMAAAKGYDEKSHELKAAWDEIARRYPQIKMRVGNPEVEPPPGDAGQGFLGFLVSMQGNPITSSIDILAMSCDLAACSADGRRKIWCAKAARLLLDHGDSTMSRMIGFQMLESSDHVSADDRERVRTFQWQLTQYMQLIHTTAGNGGAATDFDGIIQQLRRAGRVLEPPAGWKPHSSPITDSEGCQR